MIRYKVGYLVGCLAKAASITLAKSRGGRRGMQWRRESVLEIHRQSAVSGAWVCRVPPTRRDSGEGPTLQRTTFYEGPDDVHIVGRNASRAAPAKVLVFLVKAKGAPILTPVK